jgi:hypothetical protein
MIYQNEEKCDGRGENCPVLDQALVLSGLAGEGSKIVGKIFRRGADPASASRREHRGQHQARAQITIPNSGASR